MLAPFLLSVFLATVSVATGTYVVSFSNSLIPGLPLQIRVLVQNSTGPVSVFVGLKYVQNDSLIAENTTSIQNGVSTTLSITVPSTLLPSKYEVDISGSGGLVFENRSNIHFEDRSLMVFIQTDKTRYSAGQTVKYRAVLLLSNLMNFQGQATVTIQDGKENKIEVNGPNPVSNGVISGHIELSRWPVFGNWTLVIDAMGKTFTRTFKVNDYVSPKFTVQITIPEEIDTTQTSFTVDVKAMFTFYTDVIGNCTLLLYNENISRTYFAEVRRSVRFTVQMSHLRDELNRSSKIKIRAMVTDHATALTMVSERTLNIVFREERVNITHINAYKKTFIPGMVFYIKLFVSRNNQPIGQSGSLTVVPMVTTVVLEACNKLFSRYKWVNVQTIERERMTISFDEMGYAEFSYLDDTPNVKEIDFIIIFKDVNVQPYASYARIFLYPLSSSMPILRMNGDKVKTLVGESLSLDIHATENLHGNLTFEVYSRGILVTSEHVTMNNVKQNTHSISMTKEMIPMAYILVHHLTQSGYLVADYVVIEVEGNPLYNEVNVSYKTTLLHPGETVNMHISADPFSTVYILVEDKRNRIPGTGNDIFRADVVSMLKETGHSTLKNIQVFQPNKRRKRQSSKKYMKREKRSHGSFGDLDNVYIESGLVILSDAKMIEKNSDLLSNEERICDTSYVKMTFPLALDSEKPGMQRQSRNGSRSRMPSPILGISLGEILRSKFPETWIWDAYDTGATGEIDIAKTVPDTMTTWVTSVFAMNSYTGFGISDVKPEFIVKKKFFLTMELPASIVHGEQFLLQITAFNNYDVPKQVYMSIILSEDPLHPIPASTVVKANEGHSTYVKFTPKSIGLLNITVMAKSGFYSTVSDKLMKSVLVRPKGVYRTLNEQLLVDVTEENDPVTKTMKLVDPEDIVEGTKLTTVSITGNFMTPSVKGLHNLIRIPYGCGEQIMLKFAPVIYITKYLKTVGKLTPEIQKKSTQSLKAGLQQELTYQHNDGSYSAFGNKDPSGSSWLTAFVLKCFGQADGLISIDEAIMSKAMNWLLNLQRSDGSFFEPGRVILTSIQAGTASGIKLTAFILIALLENKKRAAVQGYKLDNAITNGKSYLEARLDTAPDAYSLAIVCYALAYAGSSSGSTCYTKLKDATVYNDDKTYWETTSRTAKRKVGDRSLASRAPPADIEASSYALLTYMKLGRISEAFPIVKWLVSQRNPTGGYRSSQDTIISLQALSEFSSSVFSGVAPGYGVQFNLLSSENFTHTYSTSPSTFDVVHKVEVPNNVENVMIQITGRGSAIIDVTTAYYVDGSESDDDITVNVFIIHEAINTATVRACLSWTGPEQSGMLVMEVEMPTGFQPDYDRLKFQSWIQRHETNGRNLALYFDGIDKNERICVDVKMNRAEAVVKSEACHITAYDYYDPAHQAMTRYEFGVLKEANICQVCPLCSFCMENKYGGQAGVGR